MRPATLDDAEAMEAVRTATWKASYRGYVPDAYLDRMKLTASRVDQLRRAIENDEVFERAVAVADSEVIGMGVAGPPEDKRLDAGVGFVEALYVLPGWQGRGVGRALLEHLTVGLRVIGYRTAILWTLRDRCATRRFYEANGWTFDGAEVEWGQGFSVPVVRYSCNLDEST